ARGLPAVIRRDGRDRGALGGLLSFSRRLAPLLSRRLSRVDIRAKAAIGRVPERPVACDLGVLDLADELGEAPACRLISPRLCRERRCRRLVLLKNFEKVAKRSLVEAGADVPDRLQLAVAIDADEQRAERLGATALAAVHPPITHSIVRNALIFTHAGDR